MRLALLLMLIGKVQLDVSAYQQAGGDAGFASLVHALDPRIRCAFVWNVNLVCRTDGLQY